MKSLSLNNFVLVFVVLVSSLSLSQQYKNGAKPMRYQMTPLRLDNAGLALDMNNVGQMAGNFYVPANQPTGFRRDASGTIANLVPTQGGRAFVHKLNSWGDVTGYTYGDLLPRAFRWSAAKGMETLSCGDQSFGYGINNNGDVVGTVLKNGKERGFIWDRFGGIVDIGTIDESATARTNAYAINSLQQAVGTATGADGVGRAFLWQPGAGLKVLLPDYQNSTAYAISESGRITGTVQTKNGWRVFIYDVRSGQAELYGPNNGQSIAYGIEYSGVAVGQSDGKASLFLSLKAFDLNALVDGGTPWNLTSAYAINDQGQIIVSGQLNGATEAFLLTPLW